MKQGRFCAPVHKWDMCRMLYSVLCSVSSIQLHMLCEEVFMTVSSTIEGQQVVLTHVQDLCSASCESGRGMSRLLGGGRRKKYPSGGAQIVLTAGFIGFGGSQVQPPLLGQKKVHHDMRFRRAGSLRRNKQEYPRKSLHPEAPNLFDCASVPLIQPHPQPPLPLLQGIRSYIQSILSI